MASQIETLIQEFVINLRQAIAQEAAAAFAVAGGGGEIPTPFRAKPGPKPKTAKSAPAKAAKPGGRVRRSPEDIEKQASAVLAFLKKAPGSRAEQIGAALGLSSGELAIPIASLLESKKAKKSGIKRATAYTATGK